MKGEVVVTQVLVVVSGNAAMSAAVAARERGAEVVVLEKATRDQRGGYSALAVHMRFPYDGMDDLIPLLYIAASVMVGVGLIGMGGAGYMGVGPMRRD